MKLYLIRHGRQNSRRCNVNVPLDEAGRRQAELAGARLKEYGAEKIFASDLLRAEETAEIIRSFLPVPVEIRREIREISFGEMEGLTDEEIHEKFEAFQKEFRKMERDLPYPGGECAGDGRSDPVYDGLLSGNGPGPVAGSGEKSGELQHYGAGV